MDTSISDGAESVVRDVVDKEAVAAVLFAVARAMDRRDWALLESAYLPDAIGDYETGPAEGRAAIVEMARGFLGTFTATQHLLGNVEAEIDGDSATTHATFIAQHVLDEDGSVRRVLLGGNYDDALTRTPGGWKIARRKIRGIWSDGDISALLGAHE